MYIPKNSSLLKTLKYWLYFNTSFLSLVKVAPSYIDNIIASLWNWAQCYNFRQSYEEKIDVELLNSSSLAASKHSTWINCFSFSLSFSHKTQKSRSVTHITSDWVGSHVQLPLKVWIGIHATFIQPSVPTFASIAVCIGELGDALSMMIREWGRSIRLLL